jgi:glycosyltransferase involved in cell wall biosynthesis
MVLISVIAVTYNSSGFILETLNSIYNQTWKAVELIITDDNSYDSTVEICRGWLAKNGDRFIRSELILSKVNTGVTGNANRGLRAATGKWVKFIGGDDALLPDCLTYNMEFIFSSPETRVLFSRINNYREAFTYNNYLGTSPNGEIERDSILSPERSAESQYRMLLLSDRIHFTPSVFMHRQTILSLGGYDERFKLMEDYPLWLNLTKNGYRLYFMDKVTVNYRRHSLAINNTGNSFLINPNYFTAEPFRRLYTYPFLTPLLRGEQKTRWIMSQIFKIDLLNKPCRLNRLLLNFLTVYLNPFRYIMKARKIFMRNPGKVEF